MGSKFSGYGMFGGETLHSDKHKYRDVEQLISEARHYKKEQEPEKVTRSLQAGLLRAMETNHISSFERQMKMAKEISDEKWKEAEQNGKKYRVEDEVVTVRFTKDVDMERTLDNIRIGKVGKELYDPDGKTVISESGMQALKKAITEAHERGETSVSVRVPMMFNYNAEVYDLDPKTKEPIPMTVEDKKTLDAIQGGKFKPVEGKDGLLKHEKNNSYVKIDKNDPTKIYEADKDGNIKYKMHREKNAPMYVKNDDGPGYKLERAKNGEIGVNCDEHGYKLDEDGNRIPKIQHMTVNVDFEFTVGMQIIDKEGNNLTQVHEKDADGNIKKDMNGDPVIKADKLMGNTKDKEEWSRYVSYMSRMEHVERYARDPKLEAMRDFGIKAGKFAANEAFRTTVNMAIRTPIQAGQEAARAGDHQISQFIQMIMPAIKGQGR